MNKLKTLSNKASSEVVPIVFDYTPLGVSNISSVISVEMSTVNGVDTEAATNMFLGTPTISGTKVVQLLAGGVKGVSYKLSCLIEKGSERYLVEGIISVT